MRRSYLAATSVVAAAVLVAVAASATPVLGCGSGSAHTYLCLEKKM